VSGRVVALDGASPRAQEKLAVLTGLTVAMVSALWE
jgi:hypothetical protein